MICAPTRENIELAARLLRAGDLVAFPTETVYGLGADALNPEAVKKIYLAKGRPATNPIIVHIAALEDIKTVADFSSRPELFKQIRKLAKFWPGPLSLVLPKKQAVPDIVTAGLNSVAVRIPAHPVALQLLKAAALPIAAPSANAANYVSPTTAEHVAQSLEGEIGLILDGGGCEVGLESTVLSLLTDPPAILRPGAVTQEELSALLGEVVYRPEQAAGRAALAPGLHPIHYAPRTPLKFLDDSVLRNLPVRCGLIAFSTSAAFGNRDKFAEVETLSAAANSAEIAANLFKALRKLDDLQLELIVVDSCLEQGLGVAIMDRLRRAARSS